MTEKKRFVAIDSDEVYYITDTKDLKTLNDYVEEFSKAEYEFDEEEIVSVAKEEYWQMIYENSMSANENVNMLNQLFEENEQLKQQLSEVRKESYGNLDGINYYQEQNGHLSERISDLECENEQLKVLNKLKKVLEE